MIISLSKFPVVRPGLKGGQLACDMGLKTQPRGGLRVRARGVTMQRQIQPGEQLGLGPGIKSYLRLRERGRRRGERWLPSSSATLSELRKCLDRKWSSSGVGWKGSWWRCSREDEFDWQGGVIRATGSRSAPQPGPQHYPSRPSVRAGHQMVTLSCLALSHPLKPQL